MEAKLLLEDEDYIASVNIYIGDCQSKLSKFCNISLHSLVNGVAEVSIVKLNETHVNEYIWDLIPPQLSGIQLQSECDETTIISNENIIEWYTNFRIKA